MPSDIESRFSAVLRCSNKNCGQPVYLVGTSSVEEVYYDGPDGPERDYIAYLAPAYFVPALKLIDIPSACPPIVRSQIEAAFRLYWAEPSAAGNRLRCAVESLLTVQKVARSRLEPRKKSKSRKRRRLGLNERIEAFRNKKPEFGERLHALKWLGHEGTHSDVLTKDDILDGLEILESVLDDLYVGKAKHIESLVSEIIRSAKPRSAQRRGKKKS